MLEKRLQMLITHLDNEYELLTSYLQILKNQTQSVAAVKTKEIMSNIWEMDQLIQQNKVLVRCRQDHLKKLANLLDISIENITLTEIISRVNLPCTEKLAQQQKKIKTVIDQIKQELRTNKFLLRYALNFTHSIIQINDKALKSDMVYSKSGLKEKRVDQTKMFDQKL